MKDFDANDVVSSFSLTLTEYCLSAEHDGRDKITERHLLRETAVSSEDHDMREDQSHGWVSWLQYY